MYAFILLLLWVGISALTYADEADACTVHQRGEISWYGNQFNGRHTANGEIFDENKFTAASNTLPLGSIVRVKNLSNNRVLKVKINDTGKFYHHRIMDVSKGVAKRLGFVNQGTVKAEILR